MSTNMMSLEPPVFDATISDRERDRLTREWRANVKKHEQELAKLQAEVLEEKKNQLASSNSIPEGSLDKRRKVAEPGSETPSASTSTAPKPTSDDVNFGSEAQSTRNKKNFFICDGCNACMEFVRAQPGHSVCRNCGCDLIKHLKDDSEPDDCLDEEDYREWNDDDDNAEEGFNDDDDDDDEDNDSMRY